MSSLSRPTSSSSVAPSPLPEPPSCSSSSSSSSASSSTQILSVGAIQTIVPEGEEVRGDDPGSASDWSSTSEQSCPYEGPSWIDPKVFGITSVFLTDVSVSDCFRRVPVLEASAKESLLSFGPCSFTDRVYRERSSTEPPFFFMYTCFFSDLHVSLPLGTFTVGVLQALKVASSQLHPNTWASMQAFHLICQIFGVRPSFSCFLHFYTSHPSDPVSWNLLVSRSGNVLFKAFTASYKNFKERFFKVFVEPAGMPHFFMSSVSLGFLCLRLESLQRIRIGLVRSIRVLVSRRSSLFLTAFLQNSPRGH